MSARLEQLFERDNRFRDQIDFHPKFPGALWKYEPRKIVGLRILLPVDEVFARIDAQRVRQDTGTAMRRRPQPHQLRREPNRPVVTIVGEMGERDVDRHRPYASRAAARPNPHTFVEGP